MKALGLALAVLGALLALAAMGMDTTVAVDFGGRRVHNIGLINRQGSMLMTGLVLFAVGVLVLVLLRKKAKEPAAPEAATRNCPFCAEQIRPEAVVCRFCNRDVSASAVLTQEQQMQAHGITYADDFYWLKGQKYYHLRAALAAARKQAEADQAAKQ